MKKLFVYEITFILLGLSCSVCGALWAVDSTFAIELLLVTAFYSAFPFALPSSKEKPICAKLRVAIAFIFIFYIYQSVKKIVDGFGITLKDEFLLLCDEFLFGETLSVYMQVWQTAWFTDINSVLYILYDIYLTVFLVYCLFFLAVDKMQWIANYLFNAFFCGFILYIMIPAVGPRYAYASLYNLPINGGAVSKTIHLFIESASPGYDVFPSLHTMILLVMLNCDYYICRLRYYIMLPCAVGIIFSTMYLRYHYAIDVIAGVVVFFAIKKWFEKQYGWDSYEC
ncbi:phosphatase PAP2 family protein [Candidatus Uabimicrobium amorphum]|uniref:PAP2 superfamily protein n=1 Tax=Uabimicrobium amorphum TaxID=2596890 RepID=A0A5S9IPY1_UABAM|nr:phosphatase PAP2 family protein [Candidatus Uabimicrobium amorphum]BBM85466.1 PAP2 superfamily protein [Candidatus Uabimicrobium amorphum]